MSVGRVLSRGRARHRALMLDECAITRTGEPEWEPATGTYTSPAGILVYAGPCRFKPWTAGWEVQAGEQQVALRRYWLILPHDVPGPVELGDDTAATITEDTWMLNRPLIVIAVELATARTARRVTLEDKRA